LGLNDRIINSKEEVDKIDINNKIDYESVNKKLDELRKDSLEWLYKALGD
ncbi:MAG TPA: polysaccharide pyruvyl transferase family protein, partial [Firmicutes bacterium]|nr:polysaccharide pyruvyl transferase family protein [Bacillota bacterium]